jgi:four helix bundle protein
MAFKFESLKVWQAAIELSGEVADLVRTFPKSEMYVLSSQIQRASDSVALNIAEGSTGQSNAEFRRFLGIALRSAIEVVCCLHLGKRRGLIASEDFDRFYDRLTVLVKSIQALRNAIRS